MSPVFAETYYFVALANPHDQGHPRAVSWTAAFQGRLLTTAWVLTEFGNQMSNCCGCSTEMMAKGQPQPVSNPRRIPPFEGKRYDECAVHCDLRQWRAAA